MDERRFDVLAVGEILVDFIADAGQVSLAEARHFTVFPGGEVTNVALNTARLGGSSMLVARVGGDAFGVFLKQYLQRAGVEISHLGTVTHRPTTLVANTRQNQTPDFIAYRGADSYLSPDDMPVSLLPDTFCVHTSAFALAYEPARSTILQFITQAHAAGCLVSFDPNYDPRIWEQGADPLVVLAQICPYATLVKPSLDDCARLFGGAAQILSRPRRMRNLISFHLRKVCHDSRVPSLRTLTGYAATLPLPGRLPGIAQRCR